MKCKIATTDKEKQDALSVRRKVFIDEQNVPEEIEMDEFENDSTHFILYDKEIPIGAGRFRVIDGVGKIERICVLKEKRNKGAGKLIMNEIECYAKEKGIKKLKLNAQSHAISFYEHLGYEIVSQEFFEAGIAHRTMIKCLNNSL